jgi:single-stranded DNA-binding protein
METNKIEFTGTIERLKAVNTKSGVSMATLLLKVDQNKFKCVAFNNVAEAILKYSDGDQISVAGSGSINSWKDNKDHWHNDFQLSVWKCEINGKTIEYEKNPGDRRIDSTAGNVPLPPEPDQCSNFDYAGGPF